MTPGVWAILALLHGCGSTRRAPTPTLAPPSAHVSLPWAEVHDEGGAPAYDCGSSGPAGNALLTTPPWVRSVPSGLVVASMCRVYAHLTDEDVHVGWLPEGWHAIDAVAPSDCDGAMWVLGYDPAQRRHAAFWDAGSGPTQRWTSSPGALGAVVLGPVEGATAVVARAEGQLHHFGCGRLERSRGIPLVADASKSVVHGVTDGGVLAWTEPVGQEVVRSALRPDAEALELQVDRVGGGEAHALVAWSRAEPGAFTVVAGRAAPLGIGCPTWGVTRYTAGKVPETYASTWRFGLLVPRPSGADVVLRWMPIGERWTVEAVGACTESWDLTSLPGCVGYVAPREDHALTVVGRVHAFLPSDLVLRGVGPRAAPLDLQIPLTPGLPTRLPRRDPLGSPRGCGVPSEGEAR